MTKKSQTKPKDEKIVVFNDSESPHFFVAKHTMCKF